MHDLHHKNLRQCAVFVSSPKPSHQPTRSAPGCLYVGEIGTVGMSRPVPWVLLLDQAKQGIENINKTGAQGNGLWKPWRLAQYKTTPSGTATGKAPLFIKLPLTVLASISMIKTLSL